MLLLLAFVAQSFAFDCADLDNQVFPEFPIHNRKIEGYINSETEESVNLENDPFLLGIKKSRKILNEKKLESKKNIFYLEDLKTLKLIEGYIETLENEEKPNYSLKFLDQIEQLLNRYPNIQELICQDPEGDYHKKLLKKCLDKKIKNKTVTPQDYNNVLDSLSPYLSTPVKQGKNDYFFPTHGLLPHGTPQRQSNFRLVFEGKMPIYKKKSKSGIIWTKYEMHHLTQRNKHEKIILLEKRVHKKGSGALHSYYGPSRIDRSHFAAQKRRAIQHHMLRKLKQVYESITAGKTEASFYTSPPQSEFFN